MKSPQTQAHNEHVAQLDRDIEQMQTNIENMRERYTPDYPGLQAAVAQLANPPTKERDQASKEKPSPSTTVVDDGLITRERMEAQAVVQQLETSMKANTLEAQQIQIQTAQLNNGLKTYQGRVEDLPAAEAVRGPASG